jgi:hypothetical protein
MKEYTYFMYSTTLLRLDNDGKYFYLNPVNRWKRINMNASNPEHFKKITEAEAFLEMI